MTHEELVEDIRNWQEGDSCPVCGALPCDWAAGGKGNIKTLADLEAVKQSLTTATVTQSLTVQPVSKRYRFQPRYAWFAAGIASIAGAFAATPGHWIATTLFTAGLCLLWWGGQTRTLGGIHD